VDYESLTAAGAMMGSGGLVVMDEETCMVDIARFFMEFIQDESCGKCTPCRVGTRIETNRASTVKVGKALETTLPGVFAAGDCVSGPATVIEAVAQGNKVAMAVDTWLTTGEVDRIVYQPKRRDVAKFGEPAPLSDELHRVSPRMLPPEWRSASGFSEVELGFDEATVQAEAWRCLRCDLEWLERVGEPIPEP
jgi:hypothetical protein